MTLGSGGTAAIPRDGEAVTAGWLSAVLGASHRDAGRVAEVAGEPLGAGIGLLGALHRLDLRWEDPAAGAPASLVVKLAAPGAMSRTVGIDLGLYRNEVDFYRHLAADTVLAVGCHHAAMDDATGDFVLLLDDLSAAAVLDQIEGCPPDRAATVVAALAGHHATFWGGAGLEGHPWLRRVDDAAFVSALAGGSRRPGPWCASATATCCRRTSGTPATGSPGCCRAWRPNWRARRRPSPMATCGSTTCSSRRAGA